MVRPRAEELVRGLERCFARNDEGEALPDEQTGRLRARVLEDAGRVLDAVMRGLAGPPVERRFSLALEALVRTKGRPSLLVRNGAYVPGDPELDEKWLGALEEAGPRLPALIRSAAAWTWTAGMWAAASWSRQGLVMTNRHVLEDGFDR